METGSTVGATYRESVVIPGSSVRPFGVFGIHTRELRDFDQTDAEFLQSLANIVASAARQVAAADHQTLFVREMAHRAGNMLQLVNSIATQTFNADADNTIAWNAFSERLSALARSNYVVARGGWTSTRFAELVEETLRPFGSRVRAEGRDVLLPPELCFDLGLVVHELATNSVKYGSLGRDGGTIRVEWSLHLGDKTEAAYRRGDMVEKRRRLMQDWTDYCARPAPAAGNVTPIRGVTQG